LNPNNQHLAVGDHPFQGKPFISHGQPVISKSPSPARYTEDKDLEAPEIF